MIGGLRAIGVTAAAGALLAVGAWLHGHHRGVEGERARIAAERYEEVRATVRENLKTREKLDAANAEVARLGKQVEEKERERARLARARQQTWDRRADEDVGCAAWFDQPVACRLRDATAADR